jgi:glycine cleavage system H lipoate-binding protein
MYPRDMRYAKEHEWVHKERERLPKERDRTPTIG